MNSLAHLYESRMQQHTQDGRPLPTLADYAAATRDRPAMVEDPQARLVSLRVAKAQRDAEEHEELERFDLCD